MSNADHSVAMVAAVEHPGYNYDGIPYQIVQEGQKFNTTPSRAARLLAKGIASLDVSGKRLEFSVASDPLPLGSPVEWAAEPLQVDSVFIPAAVIHAKDPSPGTIEPVKIDKRTKAYRDSKG